MCVFNGVDLRASDRRGNVTATLLRGSIFMEATPIRNSADAEMTAGRALTEPSAKQRARRTNNPNNGGLSRNTAAGRRVSDLLRAFLRALGDPGDVLMRASAVRAAELTTAAEIARGKLLSGIGDADQVVKLENMAARTVRALGIDRKREPAGPTLAQYLASLPDE
jgi:hypothetical protein